MLRLILAFFTCGIIAIAYSASFGKDPSTKIIGGRPAIDGLIPYQVSMKQDDQHYCGGSVVEVSRKQVVVTSASCVKGTSVSTWLLYAGELDTSSISGNEQRRQLTNFVIHENYTRSRFSLVNDIAIMFYDAPFDLNDFVQPIALPQPMQETTGDVMVSGWGIYDPFNYNLSESLQYVVIPTVTNAECNRIYAPEKILETHLCAGFLEGGPNSCDGDGGGPLVALDGDYLAGIVSWGYGCEQYPGVNTKVSHYVDWIEKTVAAK